MRPAQVGSTLLTVELEERGQAIDAELEERLREAYDENGVDRSLIRWSLQRTVTERVRAVEETLNALATVRRIDKPR